LDSLKNFDSYIDKFSFLKKGLINYRPTPKRVNKNLPIFFSNYGI